MLLHTVEELGGEDDLVALAGLRERLAHDLFGLPVGVDVGGVDEVDAGVDSAVDDPDRVVVVFIAPVAEHHGAEAQAADLDARAAEDGGGLAGGFCVGLL